MPGGDGTGPMGAGPMTGRAAGFCAGYSTPGYTNPVGGGFGRGFRGGGRGRRNWFYATGLPGWARAQRGWGAFGMGASFQPPSATTAEQELSALKQQAEYLQQTLGQISQRIEELENKEQK